MPSLVFASTTPRHRRFSSRRSRVLPVESAGAGVAAARRGRRRCASAGARPGLPDFTELVEKVGPAVVNIRTTERARAARSGSAASSTRTCSTSSAGSAFRSRRSAEPRRPAHRRDARRRAAAARRRLGVHPQRRRLRDDERARRRRRRRGHRHAARQARVQGQDDRLRQALRRRAGQDRSDRPADRAHRRRRPS